MDQDNRRWNCAFISPRSSDNSRWAVLPFAVFGAFILAILAGDFLGGSLGYWGVPPMGFAGAAAVVSVAYVYAPSWKRTIATAALILGAVMAWGFLRPPSWPPVYYGGEAHQRTYLPIAATYVGGVSAWLACLFCHQRVGGWVTGLRTGQNPRTRRIAGILLAFALGYVWWNWPPDMDELQPMGEGIVTALESSRGDLGRYPISLESLDGVEFTRWFGGWRYSVQDDKFSLAIGDYWEHSFQLSYESTSGEWYLDQ